MAKLRQLRTKTFSEESLQTLENSIKEWVTERDGSGESTRKEAEIIDLHYQVNGTNYTVVIFYTE